jgi:hypothetical protein
MEALMHCLNCGTKYSPDQKFCRSCGLSLEKATLLLAELLPTAELNLQDKLRRIEWWRNIVIGGLIALVAIGGLAALINGILSVDFSNFLEGEIRKGPLNIVAWVIILLLILGAIPGALLMIHSESLRKKIKDQRSSQPVSPSDTPSTTQLLLKSQPEGMLSVTERTTELLECDHSKHPERSAVPDQR